MSELDLSFASGDYDRIRPLWDGSVKPEGIRLNVMRLPIEEIFFRMARYQEFDVSEFSLASYLISRFRGKPRFIALPVFPSRKFRHADIYINTESHIKKPEDLREAKIGTPEYQMTACVWMRGVLQEDYGVEPRKVEWFTGGTETPGREERLKLDLPAEFSVTKIPNDTTLYEMLRQKKIDALITARVPTPYTRGEKWINRLFPEYPNIEEKYFERTGIFPIMHLIVIQEQVYLDNPWIAQSLYKAFCRAKDLSFERMLDAAALPVSLPWMNYSLENTKMIMGEDYWPYGLTRNRHILEKMVTYMIRQGLLPSSFSIQPEDLFAPNTLGSFGV